MNDVQPSSSVRADDRTRTIGVAVVGMGTVGTQVIRLLNQQSDELASRIGARLRLVGVAVRDTTKDRGIDPALITGDATALVARDDVDVVIEVMGGIANCRDLLLIALRSGKSVVTANKALLAEFTGELSAAAEASGADVYFEAAVAGAIPVVGPLRRSLAGDQIERVVGIVNGTTNFILSAMESTGADYADILAEAIQLGYAEADPTADVEGHDAASKAAILASIAFHSRVTSHDVYCEGISNITPAEIKSAQSLGCSIKLLAICEKLSRADGSSAVSARVYPALLRKDHPLASVNGAYNAIVIEAEAAGRLMFYGQGAGGNPTASAIMGDLVAAARNKVQMGRAPGDSTYAALPVAAIGEVITRYHVSMDVADEKGVLATAAAAFAEHGVSISDVRQDGREGGARLVVVTHRATEQALSATVEALREQPAVHAITSVIRLEGEDSE